MMAAQTAHIGEIASILGGRDISRGFVDAMPILPSQDPILRARGAGNLAIYDEVLRDDMVKTAMQQRTLALTATEWRVEPGQDGRAERKAADFLQNMLLNMDMDSVTEKMLYGLFYGYAVAECIWAVSGANVVLDAIKVRKQRRFGFAPDGSGSSGNGGKSYVSNPVSGDHGRGNGGGGAQFNDGTITGGSGGGGCIIIEVTR